MKINAKYFTSASMEETLEKASVFFNTGKENLFTEVKRHGNEVMPWLILAYDLEGKSVAMLENINSSFMLHYEPDGVYFEVYPKRGSGLKLDRDSVLAYVQRKSIRQLNTTDMLSVLQIGEGRAKIGPPQDEILIGEDISVHIAEGSMEGYVKFLPPDKGGHSISINEVREKIIKNGIVYGIDEGALEEAFSEKNYGRSYLIAKGLEPEHGEDGYLEYHFNRTPKTAAPKENEKGKIDYRSLDLFEPVKEGQLLITRHLATKGVPGKSIRGIELKPRGGKEVLMPRSKNTLLNEEKTAMYAKSSGMVDFVSGCLTVSNVYTVKGDCDMSTGNIDFDGSIIIYGNVISGLVIKASGSITIHGVVEGSEIISGGSIELKRGIQGMDKGKLIADGSVYAQFIERAIVKTGMDVTADSIIHSNIEAGRSLIATGKRGNIMGGNIKATSEIIAHVIGSTMNTITEIEVGMVPHKRTRLSFLKTNIQKLREERDKLDKLEQYLKRNPTNVTKENSERILSSTKENKYLNNQFMEEYTEELSILENEMNNATGGKIHVSDTVYPGTRIIISNSMYRIIEPITYATFRYHNGGIVFTTYEAGQR